MSMPKTGEELLDGEIALCGSISQIQLLLKVQRALIELSSKK